jgi:hypothetical protein
MERWMMLGIFMVLRCRGFSFDNSRVVSVFGVFQASVLEDIPGECLSRAGGEGGTALPGFTV